MIIFDKRFYNEALFEKIDKIEGMSYLIPLKQNSAFIKNYGMDNPTEHLKGYTISIYIRRYFIDFYAKYHNYAYLCTVCDLIFKHHLRYLNFY